MTPHQMLGKEWGTYVVSLFLEPVEGLFRTVGAVTGRGFHDAPFRICAASAGYLRRRQGNVGHRACNRTPKPVHVIYRREIERNGKFQRQTKDKDFRTLFATALLGVNPEPSTNTTPRRTGRHPCRDLEIGVLIPNACVVHAEDGEIFWLDLGDVGFVGDG